MKTLDRAALAALALTLLGLGLRLWHLEFQSLWWDEGVSIYLSDVGVRALTVGKDFGVDLHPPGYYLLLSGWRLFLGPSVFSVRLLSVFGGVATTPLLIWLVRRFASTPAALLAGLLAAVSPIDVYYSQETRMYPFIPLVAILSLGLTMRVIEGLSLPPHVRIDRRRRVGLDMRQFWLSGWVPWIVSGAVGLYLYYYLGFLVAAEALVLFSLALRRRRLTEWFIAQVVTILLFIPWLLILERRLTPAALTLPTSTLVHLSLIGYLFEIWHDFTVGFSTPPDAAIFLLLFAVGGGVGALVLARRRLDVLVLLLTSAFVPVLAAWLAYQIRPFFFPRFILFAVIPLWVLVGVGLTAQRKFWPLSALVVLILLAGNGWTWYAERTTPRSGYAPDDYRTVFRSMASVVQRGDIVLCGYPWQAGYVSAYLSAPHVRPLFLPRRVDRRGLASLVGSHRRIWVYAYSPNHRFEGNWLAADLGRSEPTLFIDQYGDSQVRLFGPFVTASRSAPIATLGGTIALESADVLPNAPIASGSMLSVNLRWRAIAVSGADYTVFVHVVGPDGKIWGQIDSPPVGGRFPTSRWNAGEEIIDRRLVRIEHGAPPGRYHVIVGLYLPSNGKRLAVQPALLPDNQILIGAVTVGQSPSSS